MHNINVKGKRLYLINFTPALRKTYLGRVEIGAVGATNPAGLIKIGQTYAKLTVSFALRLKQSESPFQK